MSPECPPTCHPTRTASPPPREDRISPRSRCAGAARAAEFSRVPRWAAGGSGRSGAPRARDVLREEVVDEGLVAQSPPFGLAPDRVENLGVDADRDQSPGRGPEGRPAPSSHPLDLGRGSLRDVGEVNPAPHRPPALCGSPRARRRGGGPLPSPSLPLAVAPPGRGAP